jgi:competence protein ComEC
LVNFVGRCFLAARFYFGMTRKMKKIPPHEIEVRRNKILLMLFSLLFGGLFLLGSYSTKLWTWPVTRGSDFTVHFFAVGQGDAALIQCRRMQVLIDGGPSRLVLERLGRAMTLTDRTIDFVILSHSHSDHIFGLFAILERYRVKRLIISEYIGDDLLAAELIHLAHDRKVEVTSVNRGDRIQLGDCGELIVLWPDLSGRNIPGSAFDRENDLSLVLEFRPFSDSEKSARVLFTGDIGARTEEILLAKNLITATTVLKVAHHGSRYSSTFDFIQTVRPELAVISVGANRYGQPAEIVRQRLIKIGARFWRTDQLGDVNFDLARGRLISF